ncbi:MAG: transcription termination factor Rho [Acidimicrobiales bacterium]
MSGEPQIERSVLETKERDELHAIAGAMALKPGARAKKADIIDQILRATGIEVPGDASGPVGPDDVPAKPRRTRTPKAKAPAEIDGGPGSGVAGPADEVDGDYGKNTYQDADPASVAQIAAGGGGMDGRRGAVSSARDNSSGGDDPRTEANGASSFSSNGSSADLDRSSASSNADADGPAQSGPEHDSDSSTPSRGQGRQSNGRDDNGARGGGPNQGRQASNQAGSQNQNQGSHQNQGGGPQRNNQQGSFESSAEPGNRKNRRRRGRERDRAPGGGGGVERDLQGMPNNEAAFQGDPVAVEGLLDLRDEGYGFLRTKGFLPNPLDAYVSISQARRFALRKGDYVVGACRPAGPSEKYPAMLRIDSVNSMSVEEAHGRPRFEDLTPLFPDARLNLEVPGDSANMTARIVDLLSPIGKGQRGLIVSPPKAGKTTVLKQIAHSIEANHPEVHLMVLLVDERPEEVTDMRRSVKGEVVASTFDRPSEEHTLVAELAIERAKRLVEQGKDVVIVLDGITRLARAYNLAQPATGRIMSGGVDSGALYPPKKFFGSARNIEEGGSLTILATALVETGSRMDEVIFEEFKGTGNMELRLDRRLAERRIYPAIDVNASSTRHEELLFDRSQLQQVWKLRRVLNALGNDGSAAAGLELLMDKIKTTKGNDEFLAEIAKGPAPVT